MPPSKFIIPDLYINNVLIRKHPGIGRFEGVFAYRAQLLLGGKPTLYHAGFDLPERFQKDDLGKLLDLNSYPHRPFMIHLGNDAYDWMAYLADAEHGYSNAVKDARGFMDKNAENVRKRSIELFHKPITLITS